MYGKPKNPKPSSEAAFSLLEVLVAVTILSVGVLGVLTGFSLSTRASARAYRTDQAAAIARCQLEQALALPTRELEPGTGTSSRFHWTLDVEGKPHGLVRATVTVKWLERGQTESYRLSQVFVPRE